MAHAFADFYKDAKWDGIYSSPLQRSRITAEIIARPHEMRHFLHDGLTEIGYGKWEGKTVEEVERIYHDDHLTWTADPAWNPPTEGETARSVAARIHDVIDEIRSKHPDGKVLIVSHKATIRIALCSMIGIDVGRFRYRLGCPVGSVSIVQFSDHGPLVQQVGGRAHLTQQLKNLPGT